MQTKLRTILCLLLLTGVTGLAQKYDTLAVYKQGGSIDKYATAQVDSIRYKGDTVLIRNSSSYISYHMNDLDSLVFVEKRGVVYCDTLTDYDGNQYYAVQIGAQCWMEENLKTTHYSDGTAIPLVTDNTAWGNLGDNNVDKGYCWYDNDSVTNKDLYGALYTYAAAINSDSSGTNVQGVCPMGWHLPSDAEWTVLTDALGGIGIAGEKLKATSGWDSGGNGTDDIGFAALPAGYRNYVTGSFGNAGTNGFWWTSGEASASFAWYRTVNDSDADVYRGGTNKSLGKSVRCVRD